MKRSIVGVVSLGAALMGFMSSSVAEACSGPVCASGGFIGASDEETPGAPLPANAPAVRFMVSWSLSSFEPAPMLDVMLAQSSTPITATADQGEDFIDLVFSAPLTQGTTLIASGSLHTAAAGDADGCRIPAQGTWTVIEAAPLPKTLGTLEVTTSQGKVQVGGGAGCWDLAQASQARVRVELDKEAQPWGGVLAYETWVDGLRWDPTVALALGADSETNNVAFIPGGALLTQDRGVDVLYTLCEGEAPHSEENRNLAPGAHEVEIRAVVPGTDTVLVAGPVTVNLAACVADGTPGTGGTGEGNPEEEEEEEDEQDASAPTKGSSSDSGGCSASTRRSTGGGALPLWLLLLAGSVCRWRKL